MNRGTYLAGRAPEGRLEQPREVCGIDEAPARSDGTDRPIGEHRIGEVATTVLESAGTNPGRHGRSLFAEERRAGAGWRCSEPRRWPPGRVADRRGSARCRRECVPRVPDDRPAATNEPSSLANMVLTRSIALWASRVPVGSRQAGRCRSPSARGTARSSRSARDRARTGPRSSARSTRPAGRAGSAGTSRPSSGSRRRTPSSTVGRCRRPRCHRAAGRPRGCPG